MKKNKYARLREAMRKEGMLESEINGILDTIGDIDYHNKKEEELFDDEEHNVPDDEFPDFN